ncbi:MAG: TolC family protein [Bacteroidetes bacterium]|nr:TolC family protein [Bacteroidota bacterium]
MRLFNKVILTVLTSLCYHHCIAQDSVLTASGAIKLTIENNFNVIISRNEIEIGKINNNWALAGALPIISATANKTIGVNNLTQKLSNGTTTEKNGNGTQNFNAGLTVTWTVFDGFKMFATKKRLEQLELQGEYNFRKTINETVYNALSSYYNIVTLIEQKQATQEQISLYNGRYQLAQRKFEIGTGAKYEVLEAEVDLNEQRSALLALENSIALAKSNLTNLMGLKSDTSYQLIDTIIVQPLPLLDDVKAKINKQNPDMLLANNNLLILANSKKEINAKRMPVVALNGFYNFVRSRNSAGFTLLNQTYGPSGSIGVSIPLFNGGLVNKELRIADINSRNQELTIQQTKYNIETYLSNAYINYYNALKAVDLEKSNLSLATENINIAMERYRVLNITAVELRQIQISYNAIKNRLYNALNQAKQAEAEIALLTGDITNL